jgi:hypothetical protein
MEKTPSPWTIVLTGWLGFMFAAVGGAVFPRLQLAVAPILCHGAYGHGVVEVHNYAYGATSGYSTSLRCASAAHQEHGTSLVAVYGLLWVYGWVGALAIRGVYYWTKFLITKQVDAYWRRRLPPPKVSPRPLVATPQSLLGETPLPATAPTSAAGVRRSPPRMPASPDPVDQLVRLAALRDRGVLTDAEFASEKARILAS